ncbi:MAG: proton-conducting transporter membrane subunit [candidate division WOR-3 bacterium]
MILLLPIILPFLIGLLILFYPGKELKSVKNPIFLIALLTMLITFIVSIMIFSQGRVNYVIQVVPTTDWSGPGISFDLIGYSFSNFILFALLFFGLLITIYSYNQKQKNYFAYLLMTIGASSLAILSNNLVVLLLAWGGVAILLYLLVGLGRKGAETAANKALVMVGGSDVLMLLGAAFIYFQTGTLTMSEIAIPLQGALPIIAFILLLIGILTKAGAMPFHSWIPDVAEYAPVPVLAFLPGALDKLLGIYLLARLTLDLFKLTPGSAMSIVLMVIGSITIVAAVAMALFQRNLLKFLGFSTVSQVGYMVLGFGTGLTLGILGGLFHMVNNAIYKSCLFLGSGAVEERTGELNLEKLGGLSRLMPITFTTFLISSLAIAGIPPLSGFASKWLIYQGMVELVKIKPYTLIFLLAAMFGSILTLASYLMVLHSIFFGERPAEMAKVKEVGFGKVLPMVLLALLSVGFGVFAQLPIRYWLGPSLNIDPKLALTSLNLIGLWNPTLATILILFGLLLGFIIYMLRRVRAVKVSEVFIGGETVATPTRPGAIDTEEAKYPGTHFYDTIRKVKLFDDTYKIADKRFFDIYEQSRAIIGLLARALKRFQSGLLPTYLGYIFLGGLVILLIVFLLIFVFK